MPPRIPSEADFSPLTPLLPHALHFPSPRESTTSILILLHGLGDNERPFATFARSMALPGVLAISVRGTAPLPAGLGGEGEGQGQHFHWGDDLNVDSNTGDLDPDPGFDKAARLVMQKLVKEVLLDQCGWEMNDILLFGFGQGGSLALGLASRLRTIERVVDVSDDCSASTTTTTATTREEKEKLGKTFKGVVSIGGPLPQSMVPSLSSRDKSRTPVLVCQLDDDEADAVRREFADVRVVRWRRREVAMPRDREEMFPIMKFIADQLNKGFT
ncbi:alpha/beta-hydrolase [Trichoderma citrinoviride]|uniref:Alpha/beta-hydrolase n=1 Tax=Trichoderma citrinoviride TaxID=58853 RepID=A0A2T4B0I9_9HYPO|nr:alpha/beta-hydrolase [Trichoderma citrinoviride]PTB62839.1 alpha/beta-hydrolase [Trichoderma citrinoviride]